jgi:hypothetical protein
MPRMVLSAALGSGMRSAGGCARSIPRHDIKDRIRFVMPARLIFLRKAYRSKKSVIIWVTAIRNQPPSTQKSTLSACGRLQNSIWEAYHEAARCHR